MIPGLGGAPRPAGQKDFMSIKNESKISYGPGELLKPGSVDWPRPFVGVMYLLMTIGIVSFLFGIFTVNHQRAWQIYLVNFLFWSGLSAAGVIISATLQIVGSRWGVSFKRIAEGMVAFLPVSFVLFFILFAGRQDWLPWLKHPDPHKAPWLNLPFFFTRNALGLLLLYAMSFYYVYLSLKPDVAAAVRKYGVPATGLCGWMARHAADETVEASRRDKILRWYSVALIVVYSLVFSLLGFDFVMSLDPRFYSSLFGIYFFVSNLYIGFAAVDVLTFVHIRRGIHDRLLRPSQLHDQGKLTFAFCMLTGYMIFVQFLVLWYGNLPEETGFLLHRISDQPWRMISPLGVLVAVVIPFCILLSRSIKKKPAGLFVMGLCILAGMWLERFVMVVPSLWQGPSVPLGWMELAISFGFLGAAVLCYRAFTCIFPMVPVTDALFEKSLQG